ncbi:MAG: L,D-transpeptidase family protein [Chloroflexota bacterium]|nr:L,D-transpeptidase family protein [Chloroflexota bacterium]
MRVFSRSLIASILFLSLLTSGVASAAPEKAPSEHYIVVVKDEQQLYLAKGNPRAPRTSDAIKKFPVTTGGLWLLKGLETPSGFFTVIDKSNSPTQGGYDFTDTGNVTITPYFMRLDVPGRSGIGIHTYTGRTLELWRFGAKGGQTTHGCIAGPPEQILDLYNNYVQPGKTKVWVVDHPSEAFKDVAAPTEPRLTEVNGKVWRALQSPTKEQFYAVDMVQPDLGWAISGDVKVVKGKYGWESNIYRWDGKTWSLETTVPYWLHGLDMLDEDEGWAVGQNYMGGLHRKNGKWTKVAPADIETDEVYVSDVSAVSPDNVWTAGGGGEIWHWNGSEFEWHRAPEVMKTIRSVSMLSDRSGWMVGGGWDTTVPGLSKPNMPMIGRFEGEEWFRVESPVDELWYGVDAVAEDDAWAVGSNGAIIHWDGAEWRSVKSPGTARLSDVEMVNARDGWAVGDEEGVALHWDGKRWERVKLPVEEKFYEVSITKDGTAMAVGSGGAIIQLVDAAAQEATVEQAPEEATAAPTVEATQPQPTPEVATQPDEPYASAEVSTAETGSITDNPARATAINSDAGEEDSTSQASTEASVNQQPESGLKAPEEQSPEQTGARSQVAPIAAGVGGLALLAATALVLLRQRR